jgi:hypothetical protein
MRASFTLVVVALASLKTFSQDSLAIAQSPTYSYSYISVYGKVFSKKLKIEVDLGDTPEQVVAGKQYSELLTNKKSFAAVLNFMVEKEFELVESLDYTELLQGSGGSSGVVFIMRKRKE